MQTAVGEKLWFSDESGFAELIKFPASFRQSWKPPLTVMLTANGCFLDWIFNQLAGKKKIKKEIGDEVMVRVNVSISDESEGESCSTVNTVAVSVPSILFFNQEGKDSDVFNVAIEDPPREQLVHVVKGTHDKMTRAIKKKRDTAGGVLIRLIYVDPICNWGTERFSPESVNNFQLMRVPVKH